MKALLHTGLHGRVSVTSEKRFLINWSGPKTVWLTLLPGTYGIGTYASNVVTITNCLVTPGAIRTTNAGNWNEGALWDLGRRPIEGDDVTVSNTVTLTNATENLNSFTLTNATLTFSNWTTALNANNVMIGSGGTLALPAAFTTSQMSNRVWVVCTNFTLNAGGTILTDGRGFAKDNGPGTGPVVGYQGAGGGGYGGKGGDGSLFDNSLIHRGGAFYGSTNAPLDSGSGGRSDGYGPGAGGAGGGAVRIEATGTVTIDGTVTANGGSGGVISGGGGSGGAIYITCESFGGSTGGILQANGGNGILTTSSLGGGGGGGGRIAVMYQSVSGTPGVRFSANRGEVSWIHVDDNAPMDCTAPQMGTLCFSDSRLLDGVPAAWNGIGSGLNGYIIFQSTNFWTMPFLVLSNSSLGIPDGCHWQITNDLAVSTGGVVVSAHATLACGGNLILTNGANLIIYGGETNVIYTNGYGTWVGVTNTLTVMSNCWIYPFSHSTNGGSVLLRVGNLVLQNGGGINADGRGYGWAYGPGYGKTGYQSGGGGGYGGKGGKGPNAAASAGGEPYGSTNMPLDLGSGGGRDTASLAGGHGGGAVRIEASADVSINGTVTANGMICMGRSGGGGSGGGIFIRCVSFGGNANGILRADGGDGKSYAGGGGGGRIAVWIGVSQTLMDRHLAGIQTNKVICLSTNKFFGGSISVTNGTGYKNPPDVDGAYPGTCWFFTTEPPTGVMVQIL